MAHDNQQGDVQMLRTVLQCREDRLVDDLSRRADHEQVPQSGVEDMLGRDARVGAGEHHCGRMLTRGTLLATIHAA